MPSGVGQKYHVSLAQVSTASVAGTPVGYVLRPNGYSKADADTFAPRFNTGAEGLTSLDLWKTWQQNDFSGGGFQDKFNDPSKFQQLKNAVRNPIDNRLYNSPKLSSVTFGAGARTNSQAWAVYKGVLYIATNSNPVFAVGSYAPSTKTITNIKTDFVAAVTSMISAGGYLWVQGTTNGLWRFDGSTWTQTLTSAQWQATYGALLNGKIYVSGVGTNIGNISWFDPADLAASRANTGFAGDPSIAVNSMIVFNHRLYIGKADGLFAWDGMQMTTVIDYSNNIDANNFRSLTVLDGALYYLIRNMLVRFNGTTVERIQIFANYETPYTVQAAYGRLWFNTYVNTTNVGLGATAGDVRLYYYDGVGIFLYDGTTTGVTAGLDPGRIMFLSDGTYKHLVWDILGASGIANNQFFATDLLKEFTLGTSSTFNDLEIYTSEFDGGFPFVDKYTDSITLSYEGGDTGDTLTVYWRINDGTSWSGFSSTVGGTFKRLQHKIVLHRVGANSGISLTSFATRYYLSPDMKRKWALTLICQGSSESKLTLADGSDETLKAKELREQIYACRINDTPSIFEDIDTCLVSIDPGAVATSITVDTTAGFPPSGYIKIGDELILYANKTSTLFYNCTRGRWGTTAAAHAANTIVGSAYRVVIPKISNERVLAPNISGQGSAAVMSTYGNESEISLVLQEV